MFKILLIGDSGVGKTSVILRYTKGIFREEFLNSIGVDFRSKDLNYDGRKIKLQIWDTAGEERYRTITASYYRGAHAIAIVFDLTKMETFEHVKRWIEDINKYAKENVLKFIIGNKSDLVQKRQVNYIDVRNFASKMNITYFEVSAKNAENINEFFEGATKIFLSKYICEDEEKRKIILNKNKPKNKNSSSKKKKVPAEAPHKRRHLLWPGPVVLARQCECSNTLHLGILQLSAVDGTERTEELRKIVDVAVLDIQRMPEPLVRKEGANIEEPREGIHVGTADHAAGLERFRIEARRIDLRKESIEHPEVSGRGKMRNPCGAQLQHVREINYGIRMGEGLGDNGEGVAPVQHAHLDRDSRIAPEFLHQFVHGLLRANPVVHDPEIERAGPGSAFQYRLGTCGVHEQRRRGNQRRQRAAQGASPKLTHHVLHFASFLKSSKKFGYVLFTHAGSRILIGTPPRATRLKHIAMRWSL